MWCALARRPHDDVRLLSLSFWKAKLLTESANVEPFDRAQWDVLEEEKVWSVVERQPTMEMRCGRRI